MSIKYLKIFGIIKFFIVIFYLLVSQGVDHENTKTYLYCTQTEQSHENKIKIFLWKFNFKYTKIKSF